MCAVFVCTLLLMIKKLVLVRHATTVLSYIWWFRNLEETKNPAFYTNIYCLWILYSGTRSSFLMLQLFDFLTFFNFFNITYSDYGFYSHNSSETLPTPNTHKFTPLLSFIRNQIDTKIIIIKKIKLKTNINIRTG